MSGTPPYAYLCYGTPLAAAGDNLLYLYDADTMLVVGVEGVDLFEAACVAARPSDIDTSSPVGSYNTDYPYCRTALRYNMADLRSNPQIGQYVPTAPYFSIKVMLDGCDHRTPVSVSSDVQPKQPGSCVAALYPGNDPSTFFVIVDMTIAVLPIRLYFTINNGAVTRTFWVGIRDRRDGLISGAVVPSRGTDQ